MAQRWQWTEQKRAAFMLLQKGKTHAEAAAAVGVTRRTVEGWARRPAWRALWAQQVAEWQAETEASMTAWREDFTRERDEKARMRAEALEQYQRELAATYRVPAASAGGTDWRSWHQAEHPQKRSKRT